MPNADTHDTEDPSFLACIEFNGRSFFNEQKARKKAKAIYDDSQKIRTLFGFLDGAVISYSTFKIAFDLITPPDASSSGAMNDWLATPGGASAATAGTLAIITLSMLGNLFDEDAKEPLIRKLALLWPYLRDGFKGFKFAYKGLRSTLQIAKILGTDLQPMLLPVGLVLALAGMANRLWYRYYVTEPRKEYQKKNNVLLKRAQNLGMEANYEFCEMPANESAIKHNKIYLNIIHPLKLEDACVEYKVYNPYGVLEKGVIKLKDDLGFTGLDRNGKAITISFDHLRDDYAAEILACTRKNGHTASSNDEAHRQAIRAGMDGCCAIKMATVPVSAKAVLQQIHPFESAYIRVGAHRLFYVNNSTLTELTVSAEKIARYDAHIESGVNPQVLLTAQFEIITALTGHKHRETQHLPPRKLAMLAAFFSGFVDGLYTYMGIMSLTILVGGLTSTLSMPLFAAMAVCCALFTAICVINRCHEESGFQRDFLRSRLNVELVLLSKEMEAAFEEWQRISLALAEGKLLESERLHFEDQGEKLDKRITQLMKEFSLKKKQYDELIISDSKRAVLTGMRTGLYIYSAISSIMCAIAAFYAIALATFPPLILVTGVCWGIISLIGAIIWTYRVNDIKNNAFCSIVMSERPKADLSNVKLGHFNKGYIRVINPDTQLNELYYFDKRDNVFRQLNGCSGHFLRSLPTESDIKQVRASKEILFFLKKGVYQVGFLNRNGEYEQQAVDQPDIIRILDMCKQSKENVISNPKDIHDINHYLVTKFNSSLRIREYQLENYDRFVKKSEKAARLTEKQLQEIKALTGNNNEKVHFSEKKLWNLVTDMKKQWKMAKGIQPDPLKERDALTDGLHMDPSAQYHFQESLEVVRSAFSGFGKGKVADYFLNAELEKDDKGHYLDTPFTIIMSILSAIVYGIVYAFRAFGKNLRGANDVPLPSPNLPPKKTSSALAPISKQPSYRVMGSSGERRPRSPIPTGPSIVHKNPIMSGGNGVVPPPLAPTPPLPSPSPFIEEKVHDPLARYGAFAFASRSHSNLPDFASSNQLVDLAPHTQTDGLEASLVGSSLVGASSSRLASGSL